jgi:hypothetical protein
MKLIIDIPEESYKATCDGCMLPPDVESVVQGIKDGIPLPKVHGRLMILSENRLKENQINLDFSCEKWISEVGLSNATVKIIKADTAESEDSE